MGERIAKRPVPLHALTSRDDHCRGAVHYPSRSAPNELEGRHVAEITAKFDSLLTTADCGGTRDASNSVAAKSRTSYRPGRKANHTAARISANETA
jgi:hypothetical protein